MKATAVTNATAPKPIATQRAARWGSRRMIATTHRHMKGTAGSM
jgi:hypothetical protein